MWFVKDNLSMSFVTASYGLFMGIPPTGTVKNHCSKSNYVLPRSPLLSALLQLPFFAEDLHLMQLESWTQLEVNPWGNVHN